MLIPTPHQETAIQQFVNEPTRSNLNGSDVGTGKTLVSTEFIKRLGEKVNLITAPLHTRDGWERHFDLQGLDELRFVHTKNKAGQQALSDLKFGVPGNYFMGRELARLQDWRSVDIDVWCADEVHSMANSASRAFKAHNKDAMPTKHRLFSSATWFGAKFENARTISTLLWPELDGYEEVSDRVPLRWINTWCSKGYTDFWTKDEKLVARIKRTGSGEVVDSVAQGGVEVRWLVRMFQVTGEKVPGAFANALPSYVHIDSDLPPLEPIEIYYDLSPLQRKLYNQMEEESLAWLRDQNPLVVDLDVTRRIRLREISLAEPVLDENGEVQFPDDGKSSLHDVVREMMDDLMGEQILMGTHSAKFAHYLAKRLGVFAWAGKSSEESQEQAKADFLKGDLRAIVGTQAKVGEGVDRLQEAARIMFELSLNDNPVLNKQFRGRLHRTGQHKPVVDYRFIPRNTIDDSNYESHLTRELNMRQSVMGKVA